MIDFIKKRKEKMKKKDEDVETVKVLLKKTDRS
jgi:hypothetical protein